ncbi:hypothetical protein E1B28_010161 [Marasmius oreades]|uniref:Uncharacterized protein n=1 Tax=Marasmius oreades TaxID=181124 RepID=A0A9P7RWJ2_9AGAR|nr:uncharacterized protein E1B28_010161 [Marasmius oreades]KAG7091106.1 hypothetical protein E1B28_010161 [Marasmius oreades]
MSRQLNNMNPQHPIGPSAPYPEHDLLLHTIDQCPDMDNWDPGHEQYGDHVDYEKPCRKGTRGAWSSEEDRLLIQAVQTYGSKWSLVAGVVKTRSSTQCARRWSDTLDPRIDKSPWTPEQDQLLLQAVAKHGRTWANIAKMYFRGRTGLALKNRYTVIGKPKTGSMSPVDMTYEPSRRSPETHFSGSHYSTMDNQYSYPQWSASSSQAMQMPQPGYWPPGDPSVAGFGVIQTPQPYPYDPSQGQNIQYPPSMYPSGY